MLAILLDECRIQRPHVWAHYCLNRGTFLLVDLCRGTVLSSKAMFPLGMNAYVLSRFSYVWLCNPIDCTPSGFSVHGISRQEYWSGLPFPPLGDLTNPRIKPTTNSCVSWIAGGFFYPVSHLGSPQFPPVLSKYSPEYTFGHSRNSWEGWTAQGLYISFPGEKREGFCVS